MGELPGPASRTLHPTLLPPRPAKIPTLCPTLHRASVSFLHTLPRTQLNDLVPPRPATFFPSQRLHRSATSIMSLASRWDRAPGHASCSSDRVKAGLKLNRWMQQALVPVHPLVRVCMHISTHSVRLAGRKTLLGLCGTTHTGYSCKTRPWALTCCCKENI